MPCSRAGIHQVDTSNNYADGASERLLGAAIARLGGLPADRRIFSKVDAGPRHRRLRRRPGAALVRRDEGASGAGHPPAAALPRPVRADRRRGDGARRTGRGARAAAGRGRGRRDRHRRGHARPHGGVRANGCLRRRADPQPVHARGPDGRHRLRRGDRTRHGGVQRRAVRRRHPRRLETRGTKYAYTEPSPEFLAFLERLRALADESGVDLAAAALQFAMADPRVHSVVVGVSSVERLHALDGLVDAVIPEEFWAAFDALGTPPPSPAD